MNTPAQRHFETIISEKEIFKGRVFRVGVRDVLLENGEKSVREVVYHNGGVSILPIDNDGNVYLVQQYRCAFNSEVLEIPAGKLEKSENPFDAAVRELKEETGFSAEEIISLGEYWPTVGYCSEKIYLYLAKGLTAGDTHFDSDEFISCIKMPYAQLLQMCKNGQVPDGKTQLAVFKAMDYIK